MGTTNPKRIPPKATNNPTKIAVAEDPGVPSGFMIPMDRSENFSENILIFVMNLTINPK
jgi:hypothetical protein